jgi:hypothetical protein
MTPRLAAVVAAAAAAGAAPPTIPGSSPLVQWTGRRVIDAAAGTARFAWEGTQVAVTVSGATSVTASWRSTFPPGGHPRAHVYVDGALAANVSLPQPAPAWADVPLVTGLDPSSPHVVKLWYITDPISLSWDWLPNASHTLAALTLDAGTFLAPPPERTRKMLVFGDSITAGNQIDKATCAPDHSGTYGAKLCEAFSANCTTTAISGFGVLVNCCDNNATMKTVWNYAIPGDPTTVVPAEDFVPDLVAINIGTNDQNHWKGNATWAAEFIATYTDLLVNMTARWGNPGLPFFLGAGPITLDYAPLVQGVIAAARARGLKSLTFVNYTTELDGCGHPGWVGHQQMFEIAQPIVAQVMGW